MEAEDIKQLLLLVLIIAGTAMAVFRFAGDSKQRALARRYQQDEENAIDLTVSYNALVHDETDKEAVLRNNQQKARYKQRFGRNVTNPEKRSHLRSSWARNGAGRL